MKVLVSECNICLGELKENLSTTTCGHVFHSACIKNCQDKHIINCPICRSNYQVIPLKNFNLSLLKSDSPNKDSDESNQSSSTLSTDFMNHLNSLNSQIEKLTKKNKILDAELKLSKKNTDYSLTIYNDLYNKVDFLKNSLKIQEDISKDLMKKNQDLTKMLYLAAEGKEYYKNAQKNNNEDIKRLTEELKNSEEQLKKTRAKNAELIKENKKLFQVQGNRDLSKERKRNYNQAGIEASNVDKEINTAKTKKN